jgi:hypothetical protein
MKRTLSPTHAFYNKALLLINLILLSAINIFAQGPPEPLPNQRWSTVGNNTANTDFLGTTNNQSLIFKTNNLARFEINPNGDLLLKRLEGLGDGLVKHDNGGKIERIPFNNSFTQVLSSSGVWKEISTFTGLTLNGNDIIQTTSGNIGIGTTTPTAKLSVNGDTKIDGNLLTNSFKIGTSNEFLDFNTSFSFGEQVLAIGRPPLPVKSCIPNITEATTVQVPRLMVVGNVASKYSGL